MSDIRDLSIATLALIFLSIIFVIQSFSFHVRLPIIGRTRTTNDFMTAPVLAIILLCAAQCICTGDRIFGTDGILTLFIAQALMAMTGDGGNHTRKLYFYLYFLFTTITTFLLAQTPLPSTHTTTAAVPGVTGNNAGAEAENGAGVATAPRKRKPRKGRRVRRTGALPGTPTPSLTVSETILGYGSNGTVVYQGSFQGRDVAVKRLLKEYVTLANREVSILRQSDDHPNVVRYFYQELHPEFFYIALELCLGSLADIIENLPDREGGSRKEEWGDILREFDAKRAMRQVASGLMHLHELGLVHRDIKPQNILISSLLGGRGYRMLISDFGLCKKLDVDQTSFLPTANGAMAAEPMGWRAPEILRGEVGLDGLSTGDDSESLATINDASSSSSDTTTRLTKSVDIFALGCLFYYILTNGGHPYGDRFDREANIIKDNKQLSLLPQICSAEESTEIEDLITRMLHSQPSQRPDIKACLLHPFFWDSAKRLGFLQDASDRFNDMCRDPKDLALIRLERDQRRVVGSDWYQRLDQILIENLSKYRGYDGSSVRDLMRALRNKKHHYQDLPDELKRHLGPIPEGFLAYFTCRYPRLVMHVHEVVQETELHREAMFRTYFELPEA